MEDEIKMLRSPSNPILNRTKSCSMYEVRGKLVGFIAFVCVILLIPFMMPSHTEPETNDKLSNYKQAKILSGKFNRKQENGNEDSAVKPSKKTITDIYAVVFDAGSTGSRVHVFHFKSDNGHLQLIKDLFKEVKPGLSSYASNPKKGAESLRELLNIALAEVPSQFQSRTPITLMATAGLRLLPEGVADNLLNEVRVILKEYPFKLSDNGVDIMDGTCEGVFSWMTVAFLTGDLSGASSNVAALDMGGGSTQITFVPSQQETLNSIPKDFTDSVELFQQKIKLYTHSYLGYGLMSTRFKLLGGKKNTAQKNLKSVCIPETSDTVWAYGGNVYNVSGEPHSSFNSCNIIVKNFVTEDIKSVWELQKHKIYIFSYFFDAARDAGLIDPDIMGDITVSDLKRAAKKAFDSPSHKYPFLGLDLLYMNSLLSDGYKLRPKTKLNVIKKIKKIEVSWGLGAAFKLLSSNGMIS